MACRSFIQSVELADGYGDHDVSGRAPGLGWMSPRISFSNDIQQADGQSNSLAEVKEDYGSHSTEFEFSMSMPASEAPTNGAMLSADELFYKGKLLPLHLPPRIQMVQDLSMREKKESLTRANSSSVDRLFCSAPLPSKSSPYSFKSSSYPPPGHSSVPPSVPQVTKCSSRWKDLFGFRKGQTPALKDSSSHSGKQATSSKLLKLIFRSSSSTGMDSKTGLDGSNQTSEPLLSSYREVGDGGSAVSSSTTIASAIFAEASQCYAPDPADAGHVQVDIRQMGRSGSKSSTNKGFVRTDDPGVRNGNRNRGFGSPNRRRNAPGKLVLRASDKVAGNDARNVDSGRIMAKNLQRSGSNRKNGLKNQTDQIWRRPEKGGAGSGGGSYSSVRVTPVLHVPSCISPSLKGVKVHSFRRLFSSSHKDNHPLTTTVA